MDILLDNVLFLMLPPSRHLQLEHSRKKHDPCLLIVAAVGGGAGGGVGAKFWCCGVGVDNIVVDVVVVGGGGGSGILISCNSAQRRVGMTCRIAPQERGQNQRSVGEVITLR